ncbi:hypothetical protein, partial [Duganella sp. Root1480D1]|uniref:hypothetical protein n=1 Tax=Duganella sp. Root1480D1 TaxID=1736471 RepID=UPI000A449D1C
FDVATTGVYSTDFDPPSANDRAPELQFIADHTVEEGKQVSFIVEGSSAAGKPVALSAAPLPAGARFTQQAADPQSPGLARGVFDWTPATGSKGDYVIAYTANDGTRTAQRSAAITVTAAPVTAGPALPTIVSPLPGAHVGQAKPTLSVMPGTKQDDPTTKLQFELYADAGHAQLLATALVDKTPFTSDSGGAVVPVATNWTVPLDLDVATKYWWRVRSSNGTLYSAWVYGRIENPVVNDDLLPFNLISPAPGAEVSSVSPGFTWFRTGPKQTGLLGGTYYTFTIYKDAALTTVAKSGSVMADPMKHEPSDNVASGGLQFSTLTDNTTYYWRVAATANGITRVSTARAFTVRTSNKAPAAPKLNMPLAGSVLGANGVTLSVTNASDPEGAPLTYLFEIDSAKTFDSAAKRVSAPVPAGSSTTEWVVDNLQENTKYWWRAKASDGKAESDWVRGDFRVNLANDAPTVPVLKNPGNGAWTSQLQPTLEVFPALDPEEGALRYEFELYKDAGMTQLAGGGISNSTGFIAPASLQDKSSYWWRARAIDAEGMSSAWSVPSQFMIQSGPVQLAPPLLVSQARRGTMSKEVVWEGLDPEREQLVSLYYGTSRGDFVGTPIVEGLRQARGATGGRYTWQADGLTQDPPPAGAYNIFMVVQDGQSVSKAYAPGSLVWWTPMPARIQSSFPAVVFEGASATFSLTQTIAAGKDVAYSTSGPGYLGGYDFVKTATSGSIAMTLIYPYQCSKQVSPPANSFFAYSEDPLLAGRTVTAQPGSMMFTTSNTGDETLRLCEMKVIAERKIDANQSEFTVTGRLSNLGSALKGAVATPLPVLDGQMLNAGVTAASGVLTFGAINSMETGSTPATVTVRARPGNAGIVAIMLKGLKWSVQVTR